MSIVAASGSPILELPLLPARRGRWRHLPPAVIVSGGFLLVVVVAAVFAPILAPDAPNVGSLSQRLLPIGSSGHLLGTDGQGRDILSRLMWGGRPSLLAGVVPVLVAGTVGTTLGIVAGLGSSRLRSIVMRSLDVLYAFPAVLLAIAIAAALGAGVSNAIIALSVVLIPPVARVAETEVLRLREADFMAAARVSGARWGPVAWGQVVPNIAAPMLVYCTALVGLSIIYAGGLSFLGLGVAPPQAEWGQMLNDLRQNLYDSPALALVPAVMILVVSLAFNTLGDGLRDLLVNRSEVVA